MVKQLLICCLLLLTATPLYAGVEPFYKGEWDMTTAEIAALETAPRTGQGFTPSFRGMLLYVEYAAEIWDCPDARVRYGFDPATLQLKQVVVNMPLPVSRMPDFFSWTGQAVKTVSNAPAFADWGSCQKQLDTYGKQPGDEKLGQHSWLVLSYWVAPYASARMWAGFTVVGDRAEYSACFGFYDDRDDFFDSHFVDFVMNDSAESHALPAFIHGQPANDAAPH